MKVNELREKLAKLKKDDVAKLAVEFYKLIPKAKKEENGIDEMISNPEKKKEPAKNTDELSIAEIEKEVGEFIQNVRNFCYVSPNRTVPKKERATWRFKVKKWHKELTKTKRVDVNLELQARILKELYEILCESCHYVYFTAYDTFESVGIDQDDFFSAIIDLHHKAIGKSDSLEMSIRLVVDNALNRYTLYSTLMYIVIEKHNIPDLKYKAIEICKELLKKNELEMKTIEKKGSGFYSSKEYYVAKKHNNLVEFVLRLYLDLLEPKAGIDYYNSLYNEKSPEIKLYVLINILLVYRFGNEIREEMESKIKSGVKPREVLMKLYNMIKENKPLPEGMPY